MAEPVVGKVEVRGATNVPDTINCQIRAQRAFPVFWAVSLKPSHAGGGDRNETVRGRVGLGGGYAEQLPFKVNVFPGLPVNLGATEAAQGGQCEGTERGQ